MINKRISCLTSVADFLCPDKCDITFLLARVDEGRKAFHESTANLKVPPIYLPLAFLKQKQQFPPAEFASTPY
jgi:hypothetical protein